MRDLIVLLLIIASGLVASGVISSFYMLVTRKAEYSLKAETDGGRLFAVFLTIFTGPSVLALGTLDKQTKELAPVAYRPVILIVVALWSYLLGMMVVSLALTLPKPF